MMEGQLLVPRGGKLPAPCRAIQGVYRMLMLMTVPGPEKGRQILGRASQGVYRGLVTVPGPGKGRQVPCRVVQGVYRR